MNPSPETPGTPAPSTETPQPTAEFAPQFSYRDLELMEVSVMDNYKYLLFMVRGEYCVYLRKGEYLEWLAYIFDRIEELQANDAPCICDKVAPNFLEMQEKVPILFSTEKGEEEREIPIYECYNLLTGTTVGLLCSTQEDGEEK